MFLTTALYAALAALIILALAANVVRLRLRHGVSLGDGGRGELNRAIRAHGNAVEYTPVILILMALLEGNNGNHLALHLYGCLLVGGRLAHAWGLMGGPVRARQLGIVSNWVALLAGAVHLLVIVLA
ncbi:MAG TPA: hypothetical protein DD757_09950 [Alcanivorax sp.]|jgi:uncharacterized membrane protein YecN with MAPEG domain|uniref:MAPEG family protein n=1 Tax=Alloalcanivorax venustensis TaxID=172371 RepID=UPI000E8D0303|nr:hypothetical protein [Alcanivorax sp.]HBP76163.1 hypothetical protein [Alcanivorax sp.]|tara:strand:- start:4015 stop:4395 length:381 start_codon:yes stop_codon:yes gene_type:complete